VQESSFTQLEELTNGYQIEEEPTTIVDGPDLAAVYKWMNCMENQLPRVIADSDEDSNSTY
jgi:hypothetical protein